MHVTDQPSSDRYKAEMPEIPGVSGPGSGASRGRNSALRLVLGLLAVLVVAFLGAQWALRPRHVESRPAEPPPQIEVPSPAPDPGALAPISTEAEPGVATVEEVAKAWSSKSFFFRNRLTSENIPALLVRLPLGSLSQTSSYWAFVMNAPYGNCQLEYVTDLKKLRGDYGFRGASHPMVGNPCSRTLFDPLRLSNLPGNVWVRGAIAQGSDLRPPLGIELKIQGKAIQAIRME
jgi:hypothetical protein